MRIPAPGVEGMTEMVMSLSEEGGGGSCDGQGHPCSCAGRETPFQNMLISPKKM